MKGLRSSLGDASRSPAPLLPARRLLAAALLGLTACGGATAPAPRGPNVLLIAVDTLRADALGAHGASGDPTPAIDALAARGTRFAEARAHAPWTLPSFSSLFTSRPPHRHGAGGRLGEFRVLAPDALTLAEVLRDAGYRTSAITNVDFLSEPFGTVQGFEHVNAFAPADNRSARGAAATTDAAIERLRSADGRFFCFVHYFDPHAVYAPPPAERSRFALPGDRQGSWTFGTRQDVVGHRSGRLPVDAGLMQRAHALYAGEVAHVDAQIARLLAELDALGLTDDTLVVLTSDHGEEFFDHGGWEHGHTLHEELLHVPLVLAGPGVPSGQVRETQVGLIDVAPTICRLAEVAEPGSFVGRDLFTERPARPHLAVGNFWGPPWASWRVGDEKLVVDGEGRARLYDLARDPGEHDDVSGARTARATALRAELEAVLEFGAAPPGTTPSVTPDAMDRLKELGYVGAE